MSILDPGELRAILGVPSHVAPVAYLCVRDPREFLDVPELQQRGWSRRLPLDALVHQNRWPGGRSREPRAAPGGAR